MMFVWLRNLANQPVPQLWPEDLPHENPRVLAKHVIADEEAKLPFGVLVRLYPAPKEIAS